MRVNSTVHKANLDTALANWTIGENDVTFVKDPDNFEGIVLGNGDSRLEFPTIPSSTTEDTGKILSVDNNGVPKWNTFTNEVDSEFSEESTNPVQNKVVKEALDDINSTFDRLGENLDRYKQVVDNNEEEFNKHKLNTVSAFLEDDSSFIWTVNNQIFLSKNRRNCTLKIRTPLALTSAGQGVSCRLFFDVTTFALYDDSTENNDDTTITYKVTIDVFSTDLEDSIKVLEFTNLTKNTSYIADINVVRTKDSEEDEDYLLCMATCNPAVVQ